MNVKFKHQGMMVFIGYSTSINKDEGTIKCPIIWEEFNQRFKDILNHQPPKNELEQAVFDYGIGTYGICIDSSDHFDYWICGRYEGGSIPQGLKLITFLESDWAIFETKGKLPDSIQSLTSQILNDWFKNEGKNHLPKKIAMIEVYPSLDMDSDEYESKILVPIINK